MLNTILLAAILLVETAGMALAIAAVRKRPAEERADAGEEAAQRRESRLEEGFENLMRFEVGGRDGFGSAGDE